MLLQGKNMDDRLKKAVEILVAACQPKKIILFGSHAKGNATVDSDFDILVLEETVENRVQEIVRLRRLLSPLKIPVDLLVSSNEHFDYWRDTPGNVYFDAAAEGKVLYEKSA